MSVFFHRHNVKFPKFSCLFQKYIKQLKTLTQLKLDNSILCVITKRWGLTYFDQFISKVNEKILDVNIAKGTCWRCIFEP